MAPAMVRGYFSATHSVPIVPGWFKGIDDQLVEEAGVRQSAANQKAASREIEVLGVMEDAL